MTATNESNVSRVTRSKQEAQRMYDRISGWYDLLEGYWEERPRQLGLKYLNVTEGERVLEIGFGTGHGIVALARSVGETGQVFGLDLSPRMRDLTRDRIDRAGLGDRVRLESGDAVRLPFSPDFFDAIFMSFVLELFDTPEIPQVLGECLRVLKQGARICVVSLSKAGNASWMRDVYEWGHARFPGLLDCRPIFVGKAVEEAGFHVRQAIQQSLWGLPIEIVLASKM